MFPKMQIKQALWTLKGSQFVLVSFEEGKEAKE
jgi:hypothetical protein